MKREYLLAALALVASLYIYTLYRSEATVVNHVFSILGFDEGKKFLMNFKMPLNDWLVYSLPGGLWVFAVTIISKGLFLNIMEIKLKVCYLPIVYAVILEFLQLSGITNGTFDYNDIVATLMFGGMALLLKGKPKEVLIFSTLDLRTITTIGGYFIVFLSDTIG
ncbi:hypothetical protein [Aureibacter tunicatorum]|uniref:Uncharacterized protein n=1 Tax=Aureibacter tunicatorum TaxID=866807 RepID=A0AAE4BT97_9BACT|nr:hypothetical protein [Aureibacter tunicatorum]MDR6240566.1 hypothetical protein [Aureibacter tunicatorum]BDD06573.1 hypothetical protein AUTU_40560 [Aureibacter tunicatorum]